ncbi:MAG TPA: OsmC family protein, partial [Longimicrobium sp.]|nr:OsmC family protein [Longimicrobium sp.]
MAHGEHRYAARLVWEGNTGEGTARYTGYGREYRIVMDGKPDLAGSADAAFRGDPHLHNPEDLLVAALSACHMLSYLALCALRGVRVAAYEDRADGVMRMEPGGGGRFHEVTLRPVVTIDREEHAALARELHETAHETCFIASSCSFPVRHEAT